MDNGLVLCGSGDLATLRSVLILIVVDNGLVREYKAIHGKELPSLNPYCSGQWSRTYVKRNRS